MVHWHAAWFADDAGLVALDMQSLPWRASQRAIAGTFFLLVGVSMRFGSSGWRLARIAACAAVVTATSAVLDPGRLVTFGILHAIFLASVLARPFARLGAWAAIPGALAAAVGATTSDPRFDHPLLVWTGLGTTVPPTFDHQPFVLWFGVVLVGIAVPVPRWEVRAPALAWMGRHSLWLYMAHVPVLRGIVLLLA